ncbi:MAG: hypothetical protein JNM55_01330 [Anaerolineales bacterium]|nr:hypothetical protein [Anaerolineales bacterium]
MTIILDWLRKWYFIPLLLVISALAYLPHVSGFGYFRDDWYLMYSANALGGKAFTGIYAIDRPMRAFIMSAAYSVFGLNPLYYNLSAYLFRVLGAFAFLSTLQMLWPRQRAVAIFASVLFLIYPGFLSTPNAIDYQAQQFGLFLAHLSIALSTKAVLSIKRIERWMLWLFSILTAWVYLGLVEYFLGLEFFRLAVIAVLAGRKVGVPTWQWVKQAFVNWLPFALGPAGFLVWRLFIFESERKATDLGVQLGFFFDSPLLVGIYWTTAFLKDTFESLLLSWTIPLISLWDIPLRLRERFFAGIVVAVSILVFLLISRFEKNEETQEVENRPWHVEAFWLGFTSVVAGFIPIILSNRNADFYGLSRYMLASSSGAVIVFVVFVQQFRSRHLRYLLLCMAVGSSVLTHYLNGIQWSNSSRAMQDFWWQVSWRIPQLKEGTTLVVNYSHLPIEEDYFVWGPANFIYQPQSLEADLNRPALWGMVLTRENLTSILSHAEPEIINRRSILTYMDYGNVLVVTQPTSSSCVQVIDGQLPSVSEYEQYDIQLVAGESNIGDVILKEQAPRPPEIVFGQEPEHDWCYYYQKASLAYQRGDFQAVLDFGKKARKQGFSPLDSVEWMPFIQAAILLNDQELVLDLAPNVKKSPFLSLQACEIVKKLPIVDSGMQRFSEKTFCPINE